VREADLEDDPRLQQPDEPLIVFGPQSTMLVPDDDIPALLETHVGPKPQRGRMNIEETARTSPQMARDARSQQERPNDPVDRNVILGLFWRPSRQLAHRRGRQVNRNALSQGESAPAWSPVLADGHDTTSPSGRCKIGN
jgi:hypothetical protein